MVIQMFKIINPRIDMRPFSFELARQWLPVAFIFVLRNFTSTHAFYL